ncbi:hypothetical protein GOBAR_DD28551 [Gossypium barbadense]|nr:hypothetical protein GOBAR_DD28551 [Gossypium barbadense]
MFPLVMRWNHRPSYMRLPNELENVRLLLDQRSKIEFRYKQRIPPSLQDMNEPYKLSMRGKNDEDWTEKHNEHI